MFCGLCSGAASGGLAGISQYGQIQNVQNYSADCEHVVGQIIAAQCSLRDNCYGVTISDIRPGVMLELSRLPGHAWATACIGYIDSAFDNYSHMNTAAVSGTSFPVPTPSSINALQTPSILAQSDQKFAVTQQEHASGLRPLQDSKVTGTKSILQPATFPLTTDDLSFAQRIENKTAGYKVYEGLSPYEQIKIEEALGKLEAQRQHDEETMSPNEYCQIYPLDETCNPTPELEQEIIAIGDAPVSEVQVESAGQPMPNLGENSISSVPGQGFSNKIHGGKCTPSQRSNWFPNKILTSGKYESIDAPFEKAMIQIFRVEGECGSHPNDSGGYTCYGISSVANPDVDFTALTRPKVEDLTYQRYYKSYGIDRLPDVVRGDVLRGGFGSGQTVGIKKLQQTLGVSQTGKVDDNLIRTAENYSGDIHNAYWDTMQQFYIGLAEKNPKYKVFLNGWMNGVRLFRENGCHVVPSQPLTR